MRIPAENLVGSFAGNHHFISGVAYRAAQKIFAEPLRDELSVELLFLLAFVVPLI